MAKQNKREYKLQKRRVVVTMNTGSRVHKPKRGAGSYDRKKAKKDLRNYYR